MSETIVLDPHEEATGRFEFDVTAFIGPDGPDWGDAAIEVYMAEASRGQIPVDFRLPNRTITIPLNLLARNGLSYDQVRTMIQAKVGLWQREGGWLKREIDGTPWYADIVNASLKMGGGTTQALYEIDADAVLTLEAIPDWYGDEIDLGTETGTGEVVAVFEPGKGDHHGRVRIIVTDTSGTPQLGVLWAIRSRHYDPDDTASVVLAASDLTLLGSAEVVGPFGDYVVQGPIGSGWTPVLRSDIAGTGPLTHTGSYRVYAVCRADSNDPIRARIVWGVGDLNNPVTNDAVSIPAGGLWYLVDLGSVRLDPAPIGTHRWYWQLQASAGQGDGLRILVQRFWLFSGDEFAGALRTPINTAQGLQDYVARDEFDQSAGNLDGKTAAVGGTWDTSGDSADFTVDATGHTAKRTVHSDAANMTTGRYAISSAGAFTSQAVQIDFRHSFLNQYYNNVAFGVIARFADADNWVGAFLGAGLSEGASFVVCDGGSFLARAIRAPSEPVDGAWQSIRLFVNEAGYYFVWIWPQGASEQLIATGYDPRLATGGSHDSGQAGFYDVNATPDVLITRDFDNFAVWVPEPNAVIHANRSLELRTDGAYRQSADGTGAGPVAPLAGDLPRLPPPGLEGRVSELLVKPTRCDLQAVPYSVESTPGDGDDLSVQVLYRPSWLFVPDGGPGS